MVFTDELTSYNGVEKMGYSHQRVHHASGVYVTADAHTNTIEGFWGLFKRSVDGAHHAISAKYMQNHLNEYTFRWSHRQDETPMFVAFLGQHKSAVADKANSRIHSSRA